MRGATPAIPRLASTLVLLANGHALPSTARCAPPPANANDIQVLMVRRHAKARFMASTYVFPGGGVEDGDWNYYPQKGSSGQPGTGGAPVRADGSSLAPSAPETGAAARAWASRVAALRELAEETNCVMRGDGRLISLADWTATQGSPAAERRHETPLTDHPPTICDVSAAPLLTALGRWVTPTTCAYRYDTNFYGAIAHEALRRVSPENSGSDAIQLGAVVPQLLSLVGEQREVSDVLWVSPLEALRRHEDGHDDFTLPSPTYHLLRSLAAQPSLDAVGKLWHSQAEPQHETGGELPEVNIPPVTPFLRTNSDGARAIYIPEGYFCGLGQHSSLPRGHYHVPNHTGEGFVHYAHLYVGDNVKDLPTRTLRH